MIIVSLYPCPFDPQDRHDISAAIVLDRDGRREVYAYEEGKLTGTRSDGTLKFPERSLMMGFKELGILPDEVDHWVFPVPGREPNLDDQFLFFSWFFKAFQGSREKFDSWYKRHVHFVRHHQSHVAIAVFGSGFEDCAFLSQDGGGDEGDRRDFTFGEFFNGRFRTIADHSGVKTICSFHAFVTDAIGFSGGDNGKTSGLAAYGKVQPELERAFRSLLTIEDTGIVFDRVRFEPTTINLDKVHAPEYDRAKFINRYPSVTNVLKLCLEYLPHDVAATGESVLQDVFLEFLYDLRGRTDKRKLVLSGGLFQNVALNYRIKASGLFENVYIPMAPSDAGLSLGAALEVEHKVQPCAAVGPLSAFIGPSFSKNEICDLLDRFRLVYTQDLAPEALAARLIADGEVVGWFQGRAEFGPRSLGNRSILADPRNIASKARINQLLKKRDWFMPYAPSIQEEHFEDWVLHSEVTPYMQIAFQIKPDKRDLIPAAIHTDGSSRFHVIRKSDNPRYWNVIEQFRTLTGLPVILNTSFNRHGIATISSPRQALEHFLEGCMDFLIIDDFVLDFQKNRIAKAPHFDPKLEDQCLKEAAIERFNVVVQNGNSKQVDGYLGRLKNLFGIEGESSGSGICIDRPALSPQEAISLLREMVR